MTLEINPCHPSGVAVFTVDSLGRRPLLLGGVSAMVVALLALGGSQLVLSGGIATWTSVFALLMYVGAYQVRAILSWSHVKKFGLRRQTIGTIIHHRAEVNAP